MLSLNRQRHEHTKVSAAEEVFFRQALSELTVKLRHGWVSHKNQPLRLPDDYQYSDAMPKSVVQPATLFGPAAKGARGGNPLETFGAWLTAPENPRFTQVIANRL